jgi:hypothetical protein
MRKKRPASGKSKPGSTPDFYFGEEERSNKGVFKMTFSRSGKRIT